jgi:hypothetical protein
MSRAPMIVAATAAYLSMPAAAFAADGNDILNTPPISLIVSLVGLGVAVVLLVEALAVRKVAAGGVIADKISYVILATVCLAASAVAQWSRNFVYGVTLEQVQFASQVLVTIAMGLLAAYFASVVRALRGYIDSAKATSAGAEVSGAEEDVAGG